MLALAGLGLAGIGFVGWIAIVVRFWRHPEPPSFAEVLGPVLPSGLPVGAVHAIAFVAGMLLMLVGTAMSRARIWSQIVILVLLITAVVVLVMLTLGGAPLSVLLPRFSP